MAATACTNCSAGTYGSAVGATTSAACLDCDAGQYQDTPGSTSCLACGAGEWQPETGAAACLVRNSRRCWKAKDLKNPAFAKQEGVAVVDELASGTVDLLKPGYFCSPAGIGGQPVADADPRQCCYKAKGDKLAAAQAVQIEGATGGVLQLAVSKAAYVCEQCAGTPLESPLQCYKAKDLKSPAFGAQDGVDVTDGLATDTVDLQKPALLCLPAGLGGDPVADPDGAQCCYKAKGAKLDAAVTEAVAGDAGGPLELAVQSQALVCEPCSVALLP